MTHRRVSIKRKSARGHSLTYIWRHETCEPAMHAIRQRGGVAVAGCLDGSGASQNKPIPTGAKPLKKWRVRPDQRRALQVMRPPCSSRFISHHPGCRRERRCCLSRSSGPRGNMPRHFAAGVVWLLNISTRSYCRGMSNSGASYLQRRLGQQTRPRVRQKKGAR